MQPPWRKGESGTRRMLRQPNKPGKGERNAERRHAAQKRNANAYPCFRSHQPSRRKIERPAKLRAITDNHMSAGLLSTSRIKGPRSQKICAARSHPETEHQSLTRLAAYLHHCMHDMPRRVPYRIGSVVCLTRLHNGVLSTSKEWSRHGLSIVP